MTEHLATACHRDSAPAAGLSAAPVLLTVRQSSFKHPAFSQGALRGLIFSARPRIDSRGKKLPTNGFTSAFVKVLNRVLIDEGEFFRIIARQNQTGLR